VVITLTIIDGDRLVILVSDDINYINFYDFAEAEFHGWVKHKVCYFGQCTIEIPTRVQHPGSEVFYVWIETISPNVDDEYQRIEKPTNYQLSATVGLNNCLSSVVYPTTTFCTSTIKTLGNVYSYRDVTLRDKEAQNRFDNFLCRCPVPVITCQQRLTRFSCLESFRECDQDGFWLPVCRYECNDIVNNCGDWRNGNGVCDCERSEFTCSSNRYSDNDCTGNIMGASASPSPFPSIIPVPTATSSISLTVSVSTSFISKSPTASFSASPTPTVFADSFTIIEVDSSSALSLSPLLLLLLCVIVYF